MFSSNVDPSNQVPVFVYGGGPHTDKTFPPPGAARVRESLVLLEFIADIAGSSALMPRDPVQRARARFFITLVSDTFCPSLVPFLLGRHDDVIAAVERLEAQLDSNGAYALGPDFTIADAALAPWVARMYVIARNDIGGWEEGAGPKLVQKMESMHKWQRYANALIE